MLDRFFLDELNGETSAIIGVSGGPDSLCLLHLARQIPSLRIIVAHFNHNLRPEAAQEAEFVRAVADQMGLPFVTDSKDVSGYAKEMGLSLEEAARLLRYPFLFEQAHQYQAGLVAVGHTADDQVETVLMHFLRGAGLAGLKGMARRSCPNEFDREIPLVRPILHLWRHETEDYCRDHGIHPLLDPSNEDQAYFRNRLRHKLIPELETYNPRFKEMLVRSAEALAGDYEVSTDAMQQAWAEVVQATGNDVIAFVASVLANYSRGMLRNLIKHGMELLKPDMRNLDFKTLQRAADFVSVQDDADEGLPDRRVDLVDGLSLVQEGDTVYLSGEQGQLPTAQWPLIRGVHELRVNQEIEFDARLTLSAWEVDLLSARQEALQNEDPYLAWMDEDRLGDHFTIRTRLPGDKIKPLGMDGHSLKLSDFFINVKLPERARDGWPLVLIGEEIAWVPGYRLAHPFCLTPGTKRVVKLVLQKN